MENLPQNENYLEATCTSQSLEQTKTEGISAEEALDAIFKRAAQEQKDKATVLQQKTILQPFPSTTIPLQPFFSSFILYPPMPLVASSSVLSNSKKRPFSEDKIEDTNSCKARKKLHVTNESTINFCATQTLLSWLLPLRIFLRRKTSEHSIIVVEAEIVEIYCTNNKKLQIITEYPIGSKIYWSSLSSVVVDMEKEAKGVDIKTGTLSGISLFSILNEQGRKEWKQNKDVSSFPKTHFLRLDQCLSIPVRYGEEIVDWKKLVTKTEDENMVTLLESILQNLEIEMKKFEETKQEQSVISMLLKQKQKQGNEYNFSKMLRIEPFSAQERKALGLKSLT